MGLGSSLFSRVLEKHRKDILDERRRHDVLKCMGPISLKGAMKALSVSSPAHQPSPPPSSPTLLRHDHHALLQHPPSGRWLGVHRILPLSPETPKQRCVHMDEHRIPHCESCPLPEYRQRRRVRQIRRFRLRDCLSQYRQS
jgi:hypothetical protein